MVSGAAGSYIVTLTEDAGISTDVTILPGQDVRISGAPGLAVAPSWGSGGFTVDERGSLVLEGVSLAGSLTVQNDGALHLSQVAFVGHTYDVLLAETAVFTRQGGADPFDSQCSRPYITLIDAWRSVTNGHNGEVIADKASCNDAWAHGTGVGGERWYRFTGDGGNALPLTTPGPDHCGASFPGWLAGGIDGGQGRYPAAGEGVAEMTVCFDGGTGIPVCYSEGYRVTVGVVRCERFLLWRLPYTNPASCSEVYCTTSEL
eukprot:COSAG06_NODE_199_length_20418_cov_43.318421_15_plen_260_part_00